MEGTTLLHCIRWERGGIAICKRRCTANEQALDFGQHILHARLILSFCFYPLFDLPFHEPGEIGIQLGFRVDLTGEEVRFVEEDASLVGAAFVSAVGRNLSGKRRAERTLRGAWGFVDSVEV